MENTFLDSIKREMNYTETENGGITHKSTLDAVYDMFALGGAYRSRSDEDTSWGLLLRGTKEDRPVVRGLRLRWGLYRRSTDEKTWRGHPLYPHSA